MPFPSSHAPPLAPPHDQRRPDGVAPLPSTIRRPATIGSIAAVVAAAAATATAAVLALLLAGPAGHAASVSAQASPWPIERVGQFGGRSYSIAVEGNAAYLALGAHVDVLDVSLPRQPRKIGQYVAEQVVQDIALTDGHALVLTSGRYIDVLEIGGAIADPRLVGSLAVPAEMTEAFSDLVVAGGYAFIGGPPGLGIVDVREITAPTWIGLVSGIERVQDIALDGTLLHVATSAGDVIVVDIARPEEPRELSRLAPLVEGVAQSITVRDGRAYVGMWRYDDDPLDHVFRADGVAAGAAPLPTHVFVLVIDVAEPLAPREIGRLDLRYRLKKPGRLRLVGDTLFMLASHYSGPEARGVMGSEMRIDVSVPERPELAGSSELYNGVGNEMDVAGPWMFVAEEFGGLRVINVTDPASPELAAVYDQAIAPRAIAAGGGTAVVGDHATGGLWSLDVAQPERMTAAAQLNVGGICGADCEVALQGDIAYIADENRGFLVVDLGAPAAPRLAAQIASRIPPTAMAVSGRHAFVMARHPDSSAGSRLSIYDVSVPDATVETGFVDLAGRVSDIAHAPGYIYGVGSDGLHVIDVSDPVQPTQIATLPLGGSTWQIAVQGDTVVLLDSDGTLHVIDVGEPAHPTRIASLDAAAPDDTRGPNRVVDVVLSDRVAIVLHTFWIQAIDLRDRRRPREVAWATGASIGVPSYLADVDVDDERVYIAGDRGGIAVLTVHRPAPVAMAYLPWAVR